MLRCGGRFTTQTFISTCFSQFLFALQETDNWIVAGLQVLGYVVHGCDHGKTAILCPGLACQIRRTWDSHERCTAILVGSMMILSVYMSHGGYDEENYIAELEIVKIIMEERKKMGAKDFFIGGDLNIELKIEGGNEEFQRLDNLDWCGLCGLECRGGGEDVATYEGRVISSFRRGN